VKKAHYGIKCRVCQQRAATGVDPKSGKPWRQCGCAPYPGDPTHKDLCELDHYAHVSRRRAEAEMLAADQAEIQRKLDGPEIVVTPARLADLTDLLTECFGLDPPEKRKGPDYRHTSARQENEAGAKRRGGKNLDAG
jgi:hypothetical protein